MDFIFLIPFVALLIPILALVFSYREKAKRNKIREMELHKEILELENKNQENKIKLLEEENRKYDKIINS